MKILMTIGEVPRVGILSISRDVEQQLMFCMVCGRGGGGRMRIGIVGGAALPQTPNQRGHGNLNFDCLYVSEGGL